MWYHSYIITLKEIKKCFENDNKSVIYDVSFTIIAIYYFIETNILSQHHLIPNNYSL